MRHLRDHASRMDMVWPYLTPSPLVLCLLALCQATPDQPWSPIASGKALTPPVIGLIQSLNSIEDAPRYQEPFIKKRVRPPVYRERRRDLYGRRDLQHRRRWRRRRRFWPVWAGRRGPRYSGYRVRPRERLDWAREVRGLDWAREVPRTRRQEEEASGRGFVRTVRNLFGAPEHCLEEGRQYSCTFAPVCWVTGGVATPGCESFLYSCCRPPELGRKEKDIFEKRKQEYLEQEPECGVSRHRQFSKRIIGGEKAKFSELPWQVHIRISSYQCGGVLLNHWYIATAAHCVHRAKLNKITVHLGEYDTKDVEAEPLDSQSYKVDHIIIHPDFRYMLTQPDRYDVALLHLDRPVFYQDNIIPVCLPPGDIPLTGKVGLVAGWGKTDNSFGKTGTNILHKVLVPIIQNEECITWHEDKNIIVQLHSEMFCAGHKLGKMDACLGDSGGPLIIHYNGRWTLIGITSAGFGCAVDKQPGIYHKIGATTSWILNQISP